MPSVLSDDDKETVKRFVPKQTNKIQAVAVARLYVAYPDPGKWTNTGIQGAIVLSNDLVGNTYWLKMVDISSGNRGVIWDQEIFDTWSYNQDRTYFHSFEIEECLAGLSFVDEKEAKQFKKKMDDREKNASRATRSTPFGGAAQHSAHKHGLLGGLFGSRHASAPTPPDSPRSNLPHGRMPSLGSVNGHSPSEFAVLDAFDPQWRENFGEDLRDKGLTDDFIKENQEFIVEFLKEEQEKLMADVALRLLPHQLGDLVKQSRLLSTENRHPRASLLRQSPRRTDSLCRRRYQMLANLPTLWEGQSTLFAGPQIPDRLPHRDRRRRRCKKMRGLLVTAPTNPEPGTRSAAAASSCGCWSAPSSESPSIRGASIAASFFTACAAPSRSWQPSASTSVAIIERPPATSSTHLSAAFANIKRASATTVAVIERSSGTSFTAVIERTPCPTPTASGNSSRSAVLGDIQKAGGIRALKKVDRTQIRDRSSAAVGGSSDTGPHGSGLPPSGVAPGGGGDMANALAAALQKRKEKVSRSDDERSDNDDW
ncbi:protein Wiskott-Aldrich syndrome 1 [Colletotrichum liriopes]|uniref:Protein Wiskott-Aldrich syndrome 1 n=1 Tax=Colletotrichum liriopes TaxID=708192 RepID=A0AA37GKM7_9PEZI|nr:protein Wiskott-Aldrich syndrome 1 [Colletotrichum liriopes]